MIPREVWLRRRRSLRRGWLGALVLGCPWSVAAAESFYAARVQPIFDQACVSCHGEEKKRGGLRLHSYDALARGGESGPAIVRGGVEQSEIYRRLILPADDEEAMPPDGKTRPTPEQIEILRRWLQAGASAATPIAAIDISGLQPKEAVTAAPDYRPFISQLADLEKRQRVRLVPVSQVGTDGLILRTISDATSVDDTTLLALAPVAHLIVDAELARTRITDAGLATLGKFTNLQRLDLGYTRVTSNGISALGSLSKLETINLVSTPADDLAWKTLRELPRLRRVYIHGTVMRP